MRQVDVAIIGSGHAGLNALKEVKKIGHSWVLINGGPLGTTCARVGCMPSKAIIEFAQQLAPSKKFIHERESSEIAELLEKVRDYRDIFVDLILANTTDGMEQGKDILDGYARFIEPTLLEVNGEKIKAKKVIIATGSRTFIPRSWAHLNEHILSSESLFDLQSLPKSIAIIGLGPIGIEMAQAMHRLGVKVNAFSKSNNIAQISDPVINKEAIEIIKKEFPLYLGEEIKLNHDKKGVRVTAGTIDIHVEKIFVSIGRKANIPEGLVQLCETDAKGIPIYNHKTLQIGKLPIYIAGDALGQRMLLQDAAEEGKIAGINACNDIPHIYPQKIAMSIVFSEPNITHIGQHLNELSNIVIGQQRFGPIGRAFIMGRNRGLIRLYAQADSGRLLGASMIGPRAEHLAHLVAWAIQLKLSVYDILQLPFYHPVIEEALQDAVKETIKQLDLNTKSVLRVCN